MRDSARASYEKPTVTYWPAEELNGIEAKMSGGGGGGGYSGEKVGSTPEPYQWFRRGTKNSSTAIDINNREAAINIVVAIILYGVNPGAALAVSIAEIIVETCINNGFNALYYKQSYFELCTNASWNTPYAPIWHPFGNASYTLFYADADCVLYVDDLLLSDLEDEHFYLLDCLRNYIGC